MICPECGGNEFNTRLHAYIDVNLNENLEITTINEIVETTFTEEFIYCACCEAELTNPNI